MLNYCKFLRSIDVAGATVSIFETALYGFAVAVAGRQLCGYLHHGLRLCFAMVSRSIPFSMTNEIRNWAVIAAAMEQQGATDSQMYRRAKAMAEGKADPMPTSDPAAPYSISIA